MTSQKRYRHQENSNTNVRSRDIPPRFKRQKSASGQTPLASRSASPPPSQLQANTPTDNMTKLSSVQNLPTTSNCGSTYNTMAQQGVAYTVLPQYHDTKYADMPINSTPQQVYGYAPAVPAGQVWPVMLNPNPVLLPQAMVSPVLYNNENCAPSPPYYVSPVTQWSGSGYGSPYHSSCSSPAPSGSSPAPSVVQRVSPAPVEQAMEKPYSKSRYMDPDLRTIEMLRELERVADEKETQEAEEGGSDRKTLVSHHLRMLMCAVDRYTEGIEDELAEKSRNDDGALSHSSSPSASPPPSKPYKHHSEILVPQPSPPPSKPYKHQPEMVVPQPWVHHHPQPAQTAWSRPRPVLGANAGSVPVVQPRHQPVAEPLPFPRQAAQMPWPQVQRSPKEEAAGYNLWSSPALFDFSDMLGCPSGPGGASQSFESFQDQCFPVDKKQRKPLYRR